MHDVIMAEDHALVRWKARRQVHRGWRAVSIKGVMFWTGWGAGLMQFILVSAGGKQKGEEFRAV